MRIVLLVALVGCCGVTSKAFSQVSSTEPLTQQVETLSLKLQLAEEQLERLQSECEELRKENALLKNEGTPDDTPMGDPFAAGVVWAGEIKPSGNKTNRWAISISKRDGDKFEGVMATESPRGEKVEIQVTGKAPRNGNGLVVIESPLIGRAKIFMRGTLRNGAVALAVSGTNPMGKKNFGSATLVPKN
tara:strand:- start:15611 stop:16177 length:567 start_codon:yes stop_codon:yes gene_type:complete